VVDRTIRREAQVTTQTPLQHESARRVPLHLDPDAFRAAGHALVDQIAAFLPSIRERPVTPFESPQAVQALIGADRPLPEHGSDAEALLRSTAATLFDHSLLNGHPRFFGYITSSPAPIGMLGDLLAAAVNANVGSWRLAPVATEIEAQTVRWIADLIGYPRDGGGLLVSGGNLANMVGLFAARAAAASWDVRAAGVASSGAPRLRVYASAETHTWLQKAADLCGIGTDAVRWIPTGDDLRIDLSALHQAIATDRAAGDLPMMVVGTAGSVSTGVVDPLPQLAELCREQGIWFHIDGAYGALAAAADDVPDDLRALSRADSVAVDPHKWLYAPLEAGCVLVRDAETLRRAFAYHPPYYHFGQEATNFVDFGPQNSRGFRALKVWLALQQAGRSGYRKMIGDDIALSRRMHAAVSTHPELEPATQSLSISTFRYVPQSRRASVGTPEGEEYLNRLNAALLDRIQGSGELFVSNAVVGGRYLLRACIVNINTTTADVDAVPEIVARIGKQVEAELREG
jgi:glutamate/tyrosine decarboxylase-like PLP-dependent enzyme